MILLITTQVICNFLTIVSINFSFKTSNMNNSKPKGCLTHLSCFNDTFYLYNYTTKNY